MIGRWGRPFGERDWTSTHKYQRRTRFSTLRSPASIQSSRGANPATRAYAQGIGQALMPSTVSPYGSGVQQQQQSMPHGYTAALNVGGDFTNANAGPTALGAFRETSSGGDDWTRSV